MIDEMLKTSVLYCCLIIVASNELSLNHTNRQVTQSCGVAGISGTGLVQGVQEFTRGEWPWLVALFDQYENKYFCAGSFISGRKVLTAAHCLHEKDKKVPKTPQDFKLIFGVYDLRDPYEQGRIVLPVAQIKIHEDWNPFIGNYDADIALILTEDEIPTIKFVKPVCLWNYANDPELKEGYIAGWGLSENTTEDHEMTPKLLRVPIITQEQCFLSEPRLANLASERTFCGGSKDGSKCNDDSGAGMIIKYNNVFYLRGIVSSSPFNREHQCDVNNFAIFTNVLKFSEWIQDTFRTDDPQLASTSSDKETTSSNFQEHKAHFDKMKSGNQLISSDGLALAYKIKEAMESSDVTPQQKASYEAMKNEFPSSIKSIIWNQIVFLRNTHFNEYIYSPAPNNAYDNERLFVFTSRDGAKNSDSRWQFETDDEGKSFYIKSLRFDEYVFVGNIFSLDTNTVKTDYDRRRAFTWRNREKLDDPEFRWIVEPSDDNLIELKSVNYDEYLFASADTYNKDLRYVFTWTRKEKISNGVWEVSEA